MIVYPQGAELPDLGITWNTSTGVPIDFSVGWTFVLNLAGIYPSGAPLVLTKSTGITGNGPVSPNITITWATTGELNTLIPGNYVFQLQATNTTTSKIRDMKDILQITPVL